MTGVTFTVTFDDGPVRAALDRMAAVGSDPGLLTALGTYGRDSTINRFDSQAAPDGTPWAGLSPAYSSFKAAGYNILFLSGDLRLTQTFRVGLDEVSWGSTMVYAAVHQFGATITPKNAKALHFKLGLGGHDVFAQSVTIPARPYLGLDAEDLVEIPREAEAYMLRKFQGG